MTSMFGLVLPSAWWLTMPSWFVEAIHTISTREMNSRDATLRAMETVSGPVIPFACILAAVFIARCVSRESAVRSIANRAHHRVLGLLSVSNALF